MVARLWGSSELICSSVMASTCAISCSMPMLEFVQQLYGGEDARQSGLEVHLRRLVAAPAASCHLLEVLWVAFARTWAAVAVLREEDR